MIFEKLFNSKNPMIFDPMNGMTTPIGLPSLETLINKLPLIPGD